MEGCANDFLVTNDATPGDMARLTAATPRLCDRRRGIGGDGLVVVLPSTSADFMMRVINSDGSEAEMCGNGIRCFASFLKRMNLTRKSRLSVETLAGIKEIEFAGEQIRVNMGPPVLAGRSIPAASDRNPVVAESLDVDGRAFDVTAVSMGNPHAVIYAPELTDELVLGFGKKLECHPFFPKKVNVEFVKVLSDTEVSMRVFERGCGETMACGTGACATMVAGVLNKKGGHEVTVHLLGGDLLIQWDGDAAHPVFMTGPANWVFEGTVEL